MSLTQQDLVAIEKIVQKIVKSEIGQSENRLLEEIRKVGIEVVENRSVILQHIHNDPAWKHAT